VARLNIHDRRERLLVGAADLALRPAGALRRLVVSSESRAPARILCLRLERIGDLVMTLPALAELRALAPDASIDLVVGRWNNDVAKAISAVNRVETLDAAWLARGSGGQGIVPLLLQARRWRARHYDLAIGFEPDIRSNLLLAASGARRLAGFLSGGGGPLLDVALRYDTHAHTADNAIALVHAALGRTGPAGIGTGLALPESARLEAARLLSGRAEPIVAVHVSGGRAIKQWPEARFREVARTLIDRRGATILLTGSEADRDQVDAVLRELPAAHVVDVCGTLDLVTLAAVLDRARMIVTGDTGPMHLAAAVGTPVVAVFGPSDPARYGPRGPLDRVVRIDLPCAPCNRIRRPPARCVGHTPDCLEGIETAQVLAAIDDVLAHAVEQASGAPLARRS
jgi:ADP-heptose:LPS heptosyltransferase